MLTPPEIQSVEAHSLANADRKRYDELTEALRSVPQALDTLVVQTQWAELEQIKNRHGGMPPKK